MIVRKKTIVALLVVFFVMVFFGCSGSIDENKPLAEVKAEAQKMSAKDLQSMIGKYEKAIEVKKEELQAVLADIKKIPLKEILGEESKLLKKVAGEVKESLNALQNRIKIYMQELQKQGATAK